VAAGRPAIEAEGTRVAFVHMSTEEEVAPHFERAGLGDVPRFSDPQRALYEAFGLGEAGAFEFLAPAVFLRGVGTILKHGVGAPSGDVRQMPGVFLLRGNEILKAFRHRSIADRPDYEGLACPVARPARG
jgi:hypothetical protein